MTDCHNSKLNFWLALNHSSVPVFPAVVVLYISTVKL